MVPAFDWKEWHLTDVGRTYIFRRADWMNDKLNVYFDGDASPVQYLPNGVILGYSARMSTRTHLSTGLPLEDLGVEPDAIHKMTVRDVLQNNDDLIADAGNILSTMRGFKLIATVESSDVSAIKLNIETVNLDRLDVYVNDRPIQSIDIKGEQTKVVISKTGTGALEIQFDGYAKMNLVAIRRIQNQ
jgi:hypothetical protein